MKVIFAEEEEITDLKDFICPKCQSDLAHKDYQINKRTFGYSLIIFSLGVICGLAFALI